MFRLDTYCKVALTIIAGCLLVLTARSISLPMLPAVYAGGLDSLNFANGAGGAGITCSTDGKYVYAIGSEGIVRSDNFGIVGSWEKVLKD